jgi:carbon monoxide dehydrogenase subunit G
MATIHKEIEIELSKEFVWDAIRDVGAIHKRLVPGFVVDCKLKGDWRIVTFGNGMVVRELIVDVDDKTSRHSWSARGEPLTHHNASVQVFSEGQDKCRVVWVADLMPNEVAGGIAEMIQQALNTVLLGFLWIHVQFSAEEQNRYPEVLKFPEPSCC